MMEILLFVFPLLSIAPIIEGQGTKDTCLVESGLHFALETTKKSFQKVRDQYLDCADGEICFCDTENTSKNDMEVVLDTLKTAKPKYMSCTKEVKTTSEPPNRRPTLQPDLNSLHPPLPKDCYEVKKSGKVTNGIYAIQPPSLVGTNKTIDVYCDVAGGQFGFTVIQRRGNFTEQENFFRNSEDYKNGFGSLMRDFWLGNDNIHYLTNHENQAIVFNLQDIHGEKRFAFYDHFRIDDQSENYKMHIYGYSGSAGDAMSTHNGMYFSTMDNIQDANMYDLNCAVMGRGGWWYEDCGETNPNGRYRPGKTDEAHKCIYWGPWKKNECLKAVEIKLHPH